MNEQLRAIAELDRVIHEPGRLMIVMILSGLSECDFLYLQHETEMNKGNLPATGSPLVMWNPWERMTMQMAAMPMN